MLNPPFVYISRRLVILRSPPVMCVFRITFLWGRLVLPLHLHVQLSGPNTAIFSIHTTRIRQISNVWDRPRPHKVSVEYKGRQKYVCMRLMRKLRKRTNMEATSKWLTRPKKGMPSPEMVSMRCWINRKLNGRRPRSLSTRCHLRGCGNWSKI